MKRYISIMLIVFLFLTTTLGSMTVFADTEIDETAPVLQSVKIVDKDTIDTSREYLEIQIDIIEEGSGVSEIEFTFDAGYQGGYTWTALNGDEYELEEDLLFTGKHTVKIYMHNHFDLGEHKLVDIELKDINGNVSYYNIDDDGNEAVFTEDTKITVIEAVEKPSPTDYEAELTSLSIVKKENLDASEKMKIKVSVKAEECINYINLRFCHSETGEYFTVEFDTMIYGDPYEPGIKTGTYTFSTDMNNALPIGELVLEEIELVTEGRTPEYTKGGFPKLFDNCTIHVTKSTLNCMPIELTQLSVTDKTLNTPAVLKLSLRLNTNGNPIKRLKINYKTEYGKTISFDEEVEKIDTNTYRVSIPMSPFVAEGKLTLTGFWIYEKGMYEEQGPFDYAYYSRDDYSFMNNGDVELNSGYNITYFGSLGNSKVASILSEMSAGETAVLDCRSYKNVPKEIFLAIAGRDVTVAFIDENVQWVFNGKDIKKSKCKKINLKSTIKVVSGSSAGFPDDTKVAKLIFQNNGELPGEVEMRINYDYLAAKYKFKKENLKLTYLDTNQNATVEDSNVDMAKDQYYEYEVDHNSTFVLSKNKAKIGATTVTAVPNGLKSVKIKWKKKAGNGYYVYRATSKNGKYKKIATIKKNTTITYVDKTAKKGKTYYYKVKPYSKKKSFNKTAKMSKPCKAYTRISAPRIYECKKVKNKLRVKLYWTDKVDATKFCVYRSVKKNSGYKKIATVEHCQYVDKKVKKGKTYYYKIKAIYKTNSKCNSKLSAYKSVTVK